MVRGNDRGSSLDFCGCCHGLPWKSAGFHDKYHGSWHFFGKYQGCGHGACRGSVRGKLLCTNHCHPQKSAAISTATRARRKSAEFRCNCHGRCRGRLSADISTAVRGRPAVRGHCHVNLPTRGNHHESSRKSAENATHGGFRGCPTAAISIAIRSRPRSLPRQLPPQSTADKKIQGEAHRRIRKLAPDCEHIGLDRRSTYNKIPGTYIRGKIITLLFPYPPEIMKYSNSSQYVRRTYVSVSRVKNAMNEYSMLRSQTVSQMGWSLHTA